jgi:hypothetical protein
MNALLISLHALRASRPAVAAQAGYNNKFPAPVNVLPTVV